MKSDITQNKVPPTLKVGAVHLWLAPLSHLKDHPVHIENILSNDEVARAKRFIKPSDQEKYIASRIIIRRILARYLSMNPIDIIFDVNDHGKPYIKNQSVQFNFSHAGDYLLLGVTLNNKVGVDIEYEKNNNDFLSIAERFFSPYEYQAIINLAPQEQKAAFYHCWTLKEAFIKATGLGLSFGLSNFEVSIQGAESSALRQVQNDSPENWTLQSIVLPDLQHYHAAYALEGRCEALNINIY